MSTEADRFEIARSLEVFMDPSTYGPFDLTPDHMRMVGCIDPRNEAGGELKIIMQTAGGAIGKGHDSALASTAIDGAPHTLLEGMREDRVLQRSTVAGAHDDCRFNHGIGAVTQEEADPSDQTLDVVGKLVSRYELDPIDFYSNYRRIKDAAKINADHFAATPAEETLHNVDQLYPFHPNVIGMSGENRAGFYILNHHPYVGLNRSRVHRGDDPLTVHAYHDSVRATLDSLLGTVGMSTERRGLRLAALFSRISATQSVLCRDVPGMIFLDVVPSPHGIQVVQGILPIKDSAPDSSTNGMDQQYQPKASLATVAGR